MTTLKMPAVFTRLLQRSKTGEAPQQDASIRRETPQATVRHGRTKPGSVQKLKDFAIEVFHPKRARAERANSVYQKIAGAYVGDALAAMVDDNAEKAIINCQSAWESLTHVTSGEPEHHVRQLCGDDLREQVTQLDDDVLEKLATGFGDLSTRAATGERRAGSEKPVVDQLVFSLKAELLHRKLAAWKLEDLELLKGMRRHLDPASLNALRDLRDLAKDLLRSKDLAPTGPLPGTDFTVKQLTHAVDDIHSALNSPAQSPAGKAFQCALIAVVNERDAQKFSDFLLRSAVKAQRLEREFVVAGKTPKEAALNVWIKTVIDDAKTRGDGTLKLLQHSLNQGECGALRALLTNGGNDWLAFFGAYLDAWSDALDAALPLPAAQRSQPADEKAALLSKKTDRALLRYLQVELKEGSTTELIDRAPDIALARRTLTTASTQSLHLSSLTEAWAFFGQLALVGQVSEDVAELDRLDAELSLLNKALGRAADNADDDEVIDILKFQGGIADVRRAVKIRQELLHEA